MLHGMGSSNNLNALAVMQQTALPGPLCALAKVTFLCKVAVVFSITQQSNHSDGDE